MPWMRLASTNATSKRILMAAWTWAWKFIQTCGFSSFHPESPFERMTEIFCPNVHNQDGGVGLHPALSLANGSCDPNFGIISVGNKDVCVAIKPIPAGSQLFRQYASSFSNHGPAAERKQETVWAFGYKCDCDTWNHDWPTLYELPAIQVSLIQLQQHNNRQKWTSRSLSNTSRRIISTRSQRRKFMNASAKSALITERWRSRQSSLKTFLMILYCNALSYVWAKLINKNIFPKNSDFLFSNPDFQCTAVTWNCKKNQIKEIKVQTFYGMEFNDTSILKSKNFPQKIRLLLVLKTSLKYLSKENNWNWIKMIFFHIENESARKSIFREVLLLPIVNFDRSTDNKRKATLQRLICRSVNMNPQNTFAGSGFVVLLMNALTTRKNIKYWNNNCLLLSDYDFINPTASWLEEKVSGFVRNWRHQFYVLSKLFRFSCCQIDSRYLHDIFRDLQF